MATRGSSKRTGNNNVNTKSVNILLAIAIDEYKPHYSDLYNAVKDAEDFVILLQSKFQFEAKNTFTRYNDEATRKGIFDAFRKVKLKVEELKNQEEDLLVNLVLYFSGHGRKDKDFNLGCWVPSGVKDNNLEEHVSNIEIKFLLNSIPTFHSLAIVDCCYSGSLFTKMKGEVKKEDDTFPSRRGISSGREEEVQDGKRGKNSPFALAMFNSLDSSSSAINSSKLFSDIKDYFFENEIIQSPVYEPFKMK